MNQSSVETAADGREVLQEEDTDGSRCVVTVHQTAQTPDPKPPLRRDRAKDCARGWLARQHTMPRTVSRTQYKKKWGFTAARPVSVTGQGSVTWQSSASAVLDARDSMARMDRP